MEKKLINGHYKIIVSDEEKKQIIEMNQNGIFDRDIAKYFKVSRQFISGKIREWVGKREHGLTEDDEKVIIDLYNRYKNQTWVHEISGFGMKAINSVLLSNNISIFDNSIIRRKYFVNEEYFDVIDTQNKAYILGLLYADGFVIEDSYTVSIFLQERDKSILEKISYEIDSTYPLQFRKYDNLSNNKYLSLQNQYGICIYSKYMFNSLLSKGIVPRKSLILEYPDFLDKDLHRHFIRGYADGDGGIFAYKNGANCSFVSTLHFCEIAKNIIESQIDVHCGIYDIYKTDKPTRILQISGKKQAGTQ